MDTQKIETQARREAAHVMARCPYRDGSPERAMWLDAMASAMREAWLAAQDMTPTSAPGGAMGLTLDETSAAVETLQGDGTGEALPPLVDGDTTEPEAPGVADAP